MTTDPRPGPPFIQVARPRLPPTDAIVPYLREIDARRCYSNHGPLSERLEARFAARFGIPTGGVAVLANATLGLAMALMSVIRPDPRPGPRLCPRLCMVPAWTFVATAHAVRNAGAVPWFVDVDPDRWALTPDLARAALRTAPGPVAAVMPVVPFGAPFDLAPWEDFQDETGVPVVVDAAAAFDTLVPRSVPAVVSLHATKVLGTGEGGLVACTDPRLVLRIRQAANFGFYGSRIAELPGTNAKLSEYHAAVGLAALDAWPETRAAWMAVAGLCRRHLAPLAGVTVQPGFGESWIGSTCMVSFATAGQESVASRLQAAGIETRAWWGDGPSGHPAFRDDPCTAVPHTAFPHTVFPHTAGLAARVLGLPFAVDLGDDDMTRVAAGLERALNQTPAPGQTGAPCRL